MTIFIQDTSTQTTSGISSSVAYFSTQALPKINFNGTGGIYNPSQDNIRIFTNNTDALTIDSNQCLYGNGIGLTHLQYNNIDNKPSYFQCDYNSTLINKPSIFQSDWNSTIINKPDLTVYGTNTNLNNLSSTSSLNISNLQSTSASLTNKTNFTSLIVANSSTFLSSLNVSGITIISNNTNY